MDPAEYPRMAAAGRNHWWYAATRALLADLLSPHLAPGDRVLDVGCGTGAAGGWLVDRWPVVGLDASRSALEFYRRERPRARLVLGRVQTLPFRDGAFDAALCVTVLYHEWVVDPVAAVRELARTLRPGGTLCLLEPGFPSLRRAHDRATLTARRFRLRDLRDVASRAGLEPFRATGAYAFLGPPAWIKARLERGSDSSDLDSGDQGLAGLLPRLATLERRWLRGHDLPGGLSVVVLARKPRSA